MSVYSTVSISRSEAIRRLKKVWKTPDQMTDWELEQAMFDHFGREGLPNSELHNYNVTG